MNQFDDEEIVNQLRVAKARGETTTPFTFRYPEITKKEAYQIQRLFISEESDDKNPICGNKVGLTNQSAQENFGAEEPVLGFLTEQMIMNGNELPLEGLIDPMAEVEVAFVFGSDLKGPEVTTQRVKNSIKWLMPAIEIIDSRIDPTKDVRDLIMDNAGASRVVVGERIDYEGDIDLAQIAMTLEKNGDQVAKGSGADVMGNPVNSIVWLVNKLADFGDFLAKESIVISGSMNTPLNIEGGDRVSVLLEELGNMELTCI